MAEQSSEIETRIETQRHHLEEHVEELEAKLERVTDWRTYAPRGPGLLVVAGLSIVVGIIMIVARRPRRP
jgi:hypothetical protein